MKKLLILIALVICVFGVNAKNTKVITGAVIDENGNPIPNALVEATGGAESVTTDADGSFSIEVPIWLKSLTAKYAGLKDKKIKLNHKDQIIFEMKPKTIGYWFLDAAYSLNIAEHHNIFSRAGLMGGYLGKWGGYARVMVPFGHYIDRYCPSATIGVIKQVSNPVYLYLGAGYSHVFDTSRYYYDDIRRPEYEEGGAMFDIGAIFRINKFNFSVGYSYSTAFCYYNNHSIQLSVGYCF